MLLVIGFNSVNNYHFSYKLDIDPDIDPPKKIHDLLKKVAGKEMKGEGFTLLVCLDEDGDESVSFEDGEDYSIDDDEEEELPDDEEADDDDLHDVDEEEDDEDD